MSTLTNAIPSINISTGLYATSRKPLGSDGASTTPEIPNADEFQNDPQPNVWFTVADTAYACPTYEYDDAAKTLNGRPSMTVGIVLRPGQSAATLRATLQGGANVVLLTKEGRTVIMQPAFVDSIVGLDSRDSKVGVIRLSCKRSQMHWN